MDDLRLIDANALGRYLSDWQMNLPGDNRPNWNDAAYDTLDDVLGVINKAPTIDPASMQPQWVSVKDRLPGEDKDEYDDDNGDVRFIKCEVCVFTWSECASGICPPFEPDYKEHGYVDIAYYDIEQKIFEVGTDGEHLNAMLDRERIGYRSGTTVTHWRRMPQPPEEVVP